MDREEKRLDAALEVIKQQITLATAIIGATLAFSGHGNEAHRQRVLDWLFIAFIPLLASVASGLLALMGISFHLTGRRDPLAQANVRWFGMLQNIGFLAGLVLMVVTLRVA